MVKCRESESGIVVQGLGRRHEEVGQSSKGFSFIIYSGVVYLILEVSKRRKKDSLSFPRQRNDDPLLPLSQPPDQLLVRFLPPSGYQELER